MRIAWMGLTDLAGLDMKGLPLSTIFLPEARLRLAQVIDTDEEGRLALQLPDDAAIRLVLVQPGHLPRMIEIRPWEGRPANDHGKPLPIPLQVILTPRDGAAVKPMAERFTLLDRHGRLLVEWDRTRGVRESGPHPAPLLRRAV